MDVNELLSTSFCPYSPGNKGYTEIQWLIVVGYCNSFRNSATDYIFIPSSSSSSYYLPSSSFSLNNKNRFYATLITCLNWSEKNNKIGTEFTWSIVYVQAKTKLSTRVAN